MSNIVTVTLAAEIADERFVHINTDGEAILADTTNEAHGYCLVGGDVDDIVQVFMSGSVPSPVEGFLGRPVYLGESGAATFDPGTGRQQVGYVSDGGRLIIRISPKQASTSGDGVASAQTFFKL